MQDQTNGKLFFASDYGGGMHPALLEALVRTNAEKTVGYGEDAYCEAAREKIRAAVGRPGAAVYFLVGGSQTNATVLSGLLRPWQGVIAADTGHISSHEAGAVERGGHKVLALPHENGKLTAAAVEAFCEGFFADENHTHMVYPGAVYISQPTEYGTLYSKAELIALKAVCGRFSLPLYLDGARLAYALACPENDVTLPDLAALTDVFYIGGTKCGAAFGEALVVPEPALLPQFFTVMKGSGAVLAKGRFLGLQFAALFENGLYTRIGKNAIETAALLRRVLRERGYRLTAENPTNQIFVSVPNETVHKLSEHVAFSFWEADGPDRTVIRFVTDWAATPEEIERLALYL